MKQQAKNVSPWKFGLLTALAASLFIIFACSEELDSNSEDVQTNQSDGEVFEVVEEQPQPIGGTDAFYKYIGSEIRYPLQARRMGIEGKVFVTFVVEKDGTLSGVKAVKGIGAGCDDEAVRVVQNAPGFTPGTQRGKPVRVQMTLPVLFKLNHEKTNPDNSTQGMIILEETQPQLNKLKVDASYGNGEWSGTVYDEQGGGLPGANIMVAGTPAGTVSDLDGSFRVKANESNDLHISFVGYQSVKLAGK
jgi:TonB family protein